MQSCARVSIRGYLRNSSVLLFQTICAGPSVIAWPAPAKRLRPVLVLMSVDLCEGILEDALPAACAVEMIHTYSLIHDDLPAMDNDSLRRGRPTSHMVHGEALAILAGDTLLTHAFSSLAASALAPNVVVDCLTILSVAAGGRGMVGGQVLDLTAERGPFPGRQAGPGCAKDLTNWRFVLRGGCGIVQ